MCNVMDNSADIADATRVRNPQVSSNALQDSLFLVAPGGDILRLNFAAIKAELLYSTSLMRKE